MKSILKNSVLALLLFGASYGMAQVESDEQKAVVNNFIQLVASDDWAALSKSIAYPLKRHYPIPPIVAEVDFLERHAQLFDKNLISRITKSNIETDWSSVGSKGLMFKNGDIWLDETGNIIAVNYQSNEEKDLEKELIQADKDSLPASLKEYELPILQMQAGKFIIRIDQMQDESYRFAWWPSSTLKNNFEPAEIIEGGIQQFDGSGGNHSYTFESDFGKFVCYINQLGTSESSPAELIIYRDGSVFRTYDAIWLKN